MNKKILFAALIAVSPVVQVTASTQDMFKDINNILDNNADFTSAWHETAEDQQTGRADLQRFFDLQSILSVIKLYRDSMQSMTHEDKIATLNSIILELESIETRLEEKVRSTLVVNITKEHIDYLFIGKSKE